MSNLTKIYITGAFLVLLCAMLCACGGGNAGGPEHNKTYHIIGGVISD